LRRSAILEAQEVAEDGHYDMSTLPELNDYHDGRNCKQLRLEDFLASGFRIDVPDTVRQACRRESSQEEGWDVIRSQDGCSDGEWLVV